MTVTFNYAVVLKTLPSFSVYPYVAEKCELWFNDIFEFLFRILKVKDLRKLQFIEYHVMNVIYICWKFQNILTFIYEDMGQFICAHL